MCPAFITVKDINQPDYSFTTAHHYLVIHFNYLYYLGLSPFRFKLTNPREYSLHSNYFQKVLCGLLQLFTTIFTSYQFVIFARLTDVDKYPSQILSAWRVLILATYAPTWAFAIWRSKQNFLKILGIISQTRPNLYEMSKNVQWNGANNAFVHVLIITFMAINPVAVAGRYFFGECRIDAIGVELPQAFNALNSTDSYSYSAPINTWSIASVPEAVFRIYGGLLVVHVTATFAIASLVFRHLSIEFSIYMQNEEGGMEMVIDRYRITEEVLENLNQGVSWVIFLQIIVFITYNSHLIMTILDCQNWISLISSLLWFFEVVVSLLLAAEANSKMNRIKNWILSQKGGKCKNSNWIQMQYIHACDEPITLKGGPMFGITYGSIGTGLGLLVTYTIITLQFVSTDKQIVPS